MEFDNLLISSLFILKEEYKDDIIEALYRTQQLRGHISSRLTAKRRKSGGKFDPLPDNEPTFCDSLPGGVPAVKQLWDLFALTLKHGITTHAFTIVSGGYWSARFQADSVVEHVAGQEWFQELFSEVEDGPLGLYFTAWKKPQKWDFHSPINVTSGFVYWFTIQVAVTVSPLE